MTQKAVQETIFSMFGITDEVEEKRKREEEERRKMLEESKKNLANTNTTAAKKQEEDKLEIQVDTQFYHLGEYIPILNYVSEDEILNGVRKKKKGEEVLEPLTSEELRKRLEADYPDLVKGYTEIVYVKKKNLVIAVSRAKKKGLYSDCPKGQSPTLPKIPFSILQEFCSFAWQVYLKKNSECHADVYYDYDKNDYFIDFPEQIANAVNVEVVEDAISMAERLSTRRFRKIMEIHSHHRMSPHPSTTDDMNERGPYLYAIVGNMLDFFPSITLRYYSQEIQSHINLDPHQIFDNALKSSTPYSIDVVKEVDIV